MRRATWWSPASTCRSLPAAWVSRAWCSCACIGTDGQLISATVAKSSGFERLDAQALKDIRTARFSPLVENGRAVEWECLAPLAYELTR